MKFFTPLFLFIFGHTFCFAQDPQEEPQQNPMQQESPSKFKVVYDSAEYYLANKNYDRATVLFDQLVAGSPKNANWNFKLGFCYLNSPTEFSKSVIYLENAALAVSTSYKNKSYKEAKAPILALKYLADAYHRNFRFDDAIVKYTEFKKYFSEKNPFYQYIDHLIQVCKNAKELTQNPVNMSIKNLGPDINSPYPDYSPVVSADESMMLFTSRRPESVGGLKDESGKYFEDIYIAYRNEAETGFESAKNIGDPINTQEHEATISLSVDGQILFIYKDDEDSGSIYMTSMQGENWTVPEKVGGDVNSPYWESHATLSADGNVLYFVSNRPGGYGGRDIYRSKKLPTGEWSRAYNLGPAINTPYEEDSPFIQPGSTTLYFSSQGHNSMGGFDIFTSQFIDTGIMGGWTKPVNIGYPVNTTGDDIFFVPTIDNKRAYYSSFAQGGLGENDIYMLTLPEKEGSRLTVLRGSVLDETGAVPPGVLITVTDINNGDLVGTYFPNPKTGKYLLILPHGKTYRFTYEGDGLHTVNNTYKVEPGKAYMETEMVFILKDVILEKQTLGTVGISGIVTDIQKKIVKNVSIAVMDNTTGKSIGKYANDAKGAFHFVLERGKNYNLLFEAEGYLFQSENVNVPKEQVYSSIEKNVVLQQAVVGSKIVLKNLFFDFNKSKIRKESFVELDKAFETLKEKKNLMVEVSGYTDNKGNDKANKKLSTDRAKAVMDYLVKKGISKTRLSYKGYGPDNPIAPNDTDEGRQMNRRVELKITSK